MKYGTTEAMIVKVVITEDGKWHSSEPVDFDALPENGWFKTKGFDWNHEV